MGTETAVKETTDLLAIAARRWFDDLSDRGIIVTDRALVVRAWNGWLAAHSGISPEEAIGRTLFEVSPTIAARGLDEHYHRALAGEVRVLAHRFHRLLVPPINQADGGDVAQSARIVPLTAAGEVIGTITIIEDVSERISTERELRNQIAVSERARMVAEDASKLKDEFLATMSHEIRTPLNAVLGWTQILRTQANVKSRDRGLEVIERNASAQLRLVEDLLDMARVVSGKLRLEVTSINVQSIVQAAIDVIEPGAAAKHIAIRTRFADSEIPVNADADRLQQAVWNVLSNALKFTDPGGSINVTVARDETTVTISIGDTGHGISSDFLPYVFDRFRQGDASPSRRHGGLGLGLALTRQIVELHGGSIDVQSAGVDKGATFWVRLPIADMLVEHGPTGRSPLGQDALLGVTVLVVDDNADSREMVQLGLEAYGATVITVDSAERALAALAAGQVTPDVIVSDIGMPGADGYELIRRLRMLAEPARSTPAIAVTAYADPEHRIQALTAGYQAHVAKPAQPVAIAESIIRLRQARVARESRPTNSASA